MEVWPNAIRGGSLEESRLDISTTVKPKKRTKTYKSLHYYFCTILNDEIQLRTIDQLVIISTNYMYILTYCFIRQKKAASAKIGKKTWRF